MFEKPDLEKRKKAIGCERESFLNRVGGIWDFELDIGISGYVEIPCFNNPHGDRWHHTIHLSCDDINHSRMMLHIISLLQPAPYHHDEESIRICNKDFINSDPNSLAWLWDEHSKSLKEEVSKRGYDELFKAITFIRGGKMSLRDRIIARTGTLNKAINDSDTVLCSKVLSPGILKVFTNVDSWSSELMVKVYLDKTDSEIIESHFNVWNGADIPECNCSGCCCWDHRHDDDCPLTDPKCPIISSKCDCPECPSFEGSCICGEQFLKIKKR